MRYLTNLAIAFSGLFILGSCITEESAPKYSDAIASDIDEVTSSFAKTKVMTEDGIALLWEDKDEIALRFQSDPSTVPVGVRYVTSLKSPSASAVFVRDKSTSDIPTKLDDKYLAIHPASAWTSWAKTSYVLLAIAPDQIADDRGFDPSSALMIASSDDTEFSFRHLVAYIKFTVTSKTYEFKKIIVTPGDESQFIVSRIKVNFDDEFSSSLEPYNSSGAVNKQTRQYVTLTPEGEGNFTEGTYYLAINPDTYNNGLNFTFENEAGDKASISISRKIVMKPGDVADFGNIGILDYGYSLPHIGIYEKNGQKQGVVFHVDPGNPAQKKVISAAGDVMKWSTSNNEWRISSYKTNYDYVHTVITTSEAYIENPDDFPAVKYCDQMRSRYGGNWHLPSIDEMNILFNAYYGKTSNTAVSKGLEYTDTRALTSAGYFDSLLDYIGGDTMLGKADSYWICAQNSSGNMQYVNMMKYHNANDVQTTEKYVRCVRDIDEKESDNRVVYPQTGIGKLIEGPLTSRITDVMWDTTYNVTSGLDYYQMRVETDADEKIDIYLLRADLSKGLDIKTVISSETTTSEWHLQDLKDMADNVSTSSAPVYAIVNGDFTDQRTKLRPRGPVHCNGYIWCGNYSLDPEYEQQGVSYIGMTYDGRMTIGHRDDYVSALSSLKECTGAGVILIEGSKIVGKGSGRDPRTAIGYSSGNLIWMLTVDGRHKGTEGMTYTEMSSIFYGLGCESAVNLDGGGSAQMLARNPVSGNLEMCNWPSDPTDGNGGVPRPRLNAWAIVKKK